MCDWERSPGLCGGGYRRVGDRFGDAVVMVWDILPIPWEFPFTFYTYSPPETHSATPVQPPVDSARVSCGTVVVGMLCECCANSVAHSVVTLCTLCIFLLHSTISFLNFMFNPYQTPLDGPVACWGGGNIKKSVN